MNAQNAGLTLPAGIELIEKVAAGRMSTIYKARFMGETVALKNYSARAVDWYRKKHDRNIAIFEMSQNRNFRKVPALVPYTAKPLRVIGQDGSCSLCFLQEFVEGLTIDQLTAKLGRLPGSVLSAGELIDRTCRDEGLEGLDLFMRNVLLRESSGQWLPVLHDFKHLPTPRPSKASGGRFLARLGLGRQKVVGRTGFLKDWESATQSANHA